MSMKLSPLLTVCSLFWTLTFCANLCYFPNHEQPQTDDWSPCNNNAVAACCDFTYGECSTIGGGLCQNTEGFLYVGGCTDRTWTSPICPNYCSNTSPKDFSSLNSSLTTFSVTSDSWQEVYPCPANTYCCGSDSSCCSNSFTLNTATTTSTSSSSTSTPTTSPSSGSTSDRTLTLATAISIPLASLIVSIIALWLQWKSKYPSWVPGTEKGKFVRSRVEDDSTQLLPTGGQS